jgi:hypothetical protein
MKDRPVETSVEPAGLKGDIQHECPFRTPRRPAEFLSELLKTVENDCNLGALAELQLNQTEGEGLRDFVFLGVCDLGVGAGVIINHEPFRRHWNRASANSALALGSLGACFWTLLHGYNRLRRVCCTHVGHAERMQGGHVVRLQIESLLKLSWVTASLILWFGLKWRVDDKHAILRPAMPGCRTMTNVARSFGGSCIALLLLSPLTLGALPPCPRSGLNQQVVKYGDYTIRTIRAEDSGCLEVRKTGEVVYQEADALAYGIGNNIDGIATIPAIRVGTDVTGGGIPNAVVWSWSGGAHCCFKFQVLQLGKQFLKVAEIDAQDSVLGGSRANAQRRPRRLLPVKWGRQLRPLCSIGQCRTRPQLKVSDSVLTTKRWFKPTIQLFGLRRI